MDSIDPFLAWFSVLIHTSTSLRMKNQEVHYTVYQAVDITTSTFGGILFRMPFCVLFRLQAIIPN
jgi:hypothetical protein